MNSSTPDKALTILGAFVALPFSYLAIFVGAILSCVVAGFQIGWRA